MMGSKYLALFMLALPAMCQACYSPPAAQLVGVDEQIDGAADVSVATVFSATPAADGQVEYHFLVLERLAGPGRASFMLLGSDRPSRHDRTSLGGHADPAFWQRGGGRVMNGGDCVIHPDFTVGETYLVFYGAPVTWRSYERIATPGGAIDREDAWLQYVQRRLAARAPETR